MKKLFNALIRVPFLFVAGYIIAVFAVLYLVIANSFNALKRKKIEYSTEERKENAKKALIKMYIAAIENERKTEHPNYGYIDFLVNEIEKTEVRKKEPVL